MEEQRRAERLVVNLRWLALAAGVVMLQRAVPPLALLAGAAFVAGYNLAALITVAGAEAYRRRGLALAVATRAADLAAATLAVWSAPAWAPGAYLLYLFPILASAYAWGRRDATLAAVGLAALLNAAAVVARPGWGHLAARTLVAILGQPAVFAVGALLGLGLRSFRQREEVHEDREAKLDRLARLQGLSAAIRPSESLNHIARAALQGSGARRAALLLRTSEGDALYVKSAASADGPDMEIAADDPVARHVAATGQALVVTPSREEGRAPEGDQTAEHCACVPLVHGGTTTSRHVGEILGVLLARGKRNGAGFTESDLSLLRSLAADAAVVYVNTTVYDRLYEASIGTLRSLARSLEARDPYTQGHSSRVAAIATTLAREMGLDRRTIGMLGDAAVLHDIGKIGIPDSVLSKPASLTPEEWDSIKLHPVISEDICRPLDVSRDVLFLIRHHQERLDGSGYPDGLQSHQQPLALRILCVADAFDAMSTDRPYRQALAPETRLRELNRLAGVEFDQQVVETLKRLIEQGAFDDLYRDTAPADIAPGRYAALPQFIVRPEPEEDERAPVPAAASADGER